jgi:CHAT domain-containing protein
MKLLSQAVAAHTEHRDAEAEDYVRKALKLAEDSRGTDAELVISARILLITVLVRQFKFADARSVVRAQLDSIRRAKGEQSIEYAVTLMQLGTIQAQLNEPGTAETTYRRAIEILQASPEAKPDDIVKAKTALAAVLTLLGRNDEASALIGGEGATIESFQGTTRARIRSNRGDHEGALAELEGHFELTKLTLSYTKQTDSLELARTHMAIAAELNELARDPDKARSHIREVLRIYSLRLGTDHPITVEPWTLLSAIEIRTGSWQEALDALAKATGIVENWAATMRSNNVKTAYGLGESQSALYRARAYAAWQLKSETPARMPEMMGVAFESFQRADFSKASAALLRMAERRAEKDPRFAMLMRRVQDLSQKVAEETDAALRKAWEPGTAQTFATESQSEIELRKASTDIEREFSRGGVAASTVLTLSDAVALLKDDEALILIGEGFGQAANSGTAMALFRGRVLWTTIDHLALRKATDRLRASLGATGGARGMIPVPDSVASADLGGFDYQAAAEVYSLVLAPLEKALRESKHLIIVPSSGLFDIPFAAVMREMPKDASSPTALRDAPWLIRSHAISVLPSVASLKALRSIPPAAKGPRPMAGFGNPKFGGTASRLVPLPETAGELKRMAASVKVKGNRVLLGNAANEQAIKSEGLARFGILAFATHGLKAGELEGLAEPALVLTPDADNDGLLTASEVASLELDADWVILSACNTAAGDKPDAEGFSGLARAFLYAGARSLLVSHWPVYSDAAVKLTTGAFEELGREPSIGRAEALRRSMLRVLDRDPEAVHWHPSYWAPFALLGDGG